MDEELFIQAPLYSWEFRNKYYPHFDPMDILSKVNDLILDIKAGNLKHAFYPFIKYKQRKIKRHDNLIKNTSRSIFHTARIDSNIYSYYRSILMKKYEQFLIANKIEDVVIAYRKVANEDNTNKCNINFAFDAINNIRERIKLAGSCSAITMDIKGFFDNLDHKYIRKTWCDVMQYQKGMPEDHFTIYKNITKYSYIDKETIEKQLKIKSLRRLKRKQICSPTIFRNKIAPVLKKNNNAYGIPQGTPISDVIANMYMIYFDIVMNRYAKRYNGFYRRYSDDILYICESSNLEKSIHFIYGLIKKKCNRLELNSKKTLVSTFETDKYNKTICKTYNHNFNIVNKPFEYLGLSFNGDKIDIRNSTKSKYWKKLSIRIRSEVIFSKLQLTKRKIVQINSLRIYQNVDFQRIRNDYMKIIYEPSRAEYFSGNFYTYVKMVAQITNNNKILKIFLKAPSFIKKRAMEYSENIMTIS